MTDVNRSGDSRCAICGRPSGGELCRYHEEAAKRLAGHYVVWKDRTGASWEEYLRAVSANDLTGEWIRECAGYLLGKGIRGPRGPSA